MRRSIMLAACVGICLTGSARAYEYKLQFTPNPGARSLVVAGYQFAGETVIGNCSYVIVTSGSGRGARSHTTYYNQTCSWDLHGNLLSVMSGAPTAPVPLSSSGGLTIYAKNAQGDTTGVDTASGTLGFVNAPSAQYAWATQSGGYVFLTSQKPIALALVLQSVGDLPLVVSAVDPVARLAKASVTSTTCKTAPILPGKTCKIVVKYDPRSIPRGDDPYTAYDSLTVGVVTNAGQTPDFTESVEVPIAAGD